MGGRLDLYIINRDEASKKQGYSTHLYIKILEDQLPIIQLLGLVFMQDNAPIHTAGVVKEWFENSDIPIIEWPPYSPDLNPIEIIQAWLKEWITTNYPDLINIDASEAAYQRLYKAMQEGWESIPQSKINGLIKSIDTRVEICRLAKGWHTRFQYQRYSEILYIQVEINNQGVILPKFESIPLKV